jgi:hypothetical protein
VPLARLRQRVFTTADTFDVDVEIAHYGAKPLENVKGVWHFSAGGVEFQGEWEPKTIPIGKNISLGKISIDLSRLKLVPSEGKLVVTVGPTSFFGAINRRIIPGPGVVRGVTYFENDWNFWVYPPVDEATVKSSPACPPSRVDDLLITNLWDEAEARLAAGGKVLFSPRNSDLDWTSPPLDVVPVFWNRLMGPAWGRMLGLWIDRKPGESRALSLMFFPTSSHFDWQWAQLMPGTRAINLDRLPPELEPVVWAIDDWNRNYKLGVIFECVVGRGRLLVSAIDVTKTSNSNPVLSQLRSSLVHYARSDCFQPNVAVPEEALRSLFFDTRIMSKLHARASVGGEAAGMLIDGDPNTYLLIGDQRAPARDQVEVVINFPAPVTMSGMVLMPRQNHREHEGEIREFIVQLSDDGSVWSDVARGELPSTFAPKKIEFSRTVTARYVKLVSLSGYGTDKTTSLAELAVVYAGPKLNESGEPIEYQRNRSATPDIDEGPGREKPRPTATPKPSPMSPR